jgi:hypothetical protein
MIETHRSFCRFCHAVCGIEVDVEDGRVLAVRGDRDHVVSQGYLCVKGRELAEQHTHPSRLRGANRRTPDGGFVDVTSEAAMDEVATRLSAIIARHGPGGRHHDFIYGVAEATTDVRPGVVSMAHARGGEPELDAEVRTIGSSTARLVSVERDFEPISGIPRQSAIPVNVRALQPEELAGIAP